MRDLAAVDRQLADLASEHGVPDVKALLGRILGRDRSLARLNEQLDAFGSVGGAASPRQAAPLRDPLAAPAQRLSARPPARTFSAEPGTEPRPAVPRSDAPAGFRPNPPGVRGSLPARIVSPLAPVQGDSLKTATPWPPVASSMPPGPSAAVPAGVPAGARSPRDTLVDAAVPPPAMPQVDEVELDAATAALFGITAPPGALPQPGSSPAPTTEIPAAAAVPAEEERSQPPSSRSPRATLQQWATGLEPVEPPVFIPTQAPLPTAEALQDGRPSTRELLEREIDPNDFPSSHPPRARSIPPPLRKQAPVQQKQDSFEMLIDDAADDEIMEIDDVELEEIE
jgi:hypothetical protein